MDDSFEDGSLHEAIRRLISEDDLWLLEAHTNGISFRVIAYVLDRAPGNVCRHFHRIRRLLREHLEL